MRALVVFAKTGARQRSFEDVAKIKDVFSGRQHRVCDVLVHLTKSRAIVKIFAGGVGMRIEIMDQPRRREDPVFKTFVVVTVLRIRRQHAIVNRARQAGPCGRFGRLVVERIGSDTQAGDGNEGVILAIRIGATRLWLEVVSQQARLLDQFVSITRRARFG